MKMLFLSVNVWAVFSSPLLCAAEVPTLDLAQRDPLAFCKKVALLNPEHEEELAQLQALWEEMSQLFFLDLSVLQATADRYINFQYMMEQLDGQLQRSSKLPKQRQALRGEVMSQLLEKQINFERSFQGKLPNRLPMSAPPLQRRRSAGELHSASEQPAEVMDPFLALQCNKPGLKFGDLYAGKPDESVRAFLSNIAHSKVVGADKTPSTLNNLLLYGPKGTGKTTFAHALIAVSRYPAFRISNTLVQRSKIGESAQILAGIFERAYQYAVEKNTRVILLTDELDSVFSERAEHSDSADHNQQVAATFQTYFSDVGGVHPDFLARVMYIGITNHVEAIPDPILSRFVHQSEMSEISIEQREMVIRHLLRKNHYAGMVELQPEDYAKLANITFESKLDLRQIGAAIERCFDQAMVLKIEEDKPNVPGLEDILELLRVPPAKVTRITWKRKTAPVIEEAPQRTSKITFSVLEAEFSRETVKVEVWPSAHTYL